MNICPDKNYCCLVNTEVLVYLTTLKGKLVLPVGVINVSSGCTVGKIFSAIAVHSLIMRATDNETVVLNRRNSLVPLHFISSNKIMPIRPSRT